MIVHAFQRQADLQVQGQPGLYRVTLSQKTREKNELHILFYIYTYTHTYTQYIC